MGFGTLTIASVKSTRWFVLIILIAVLPWLNPFAPGPSPTVMPWLISVFAGLSLLVLGSLRAFANPTTDATSFPLHWAAPIAGGWLLAGLLSSVLALLQYFDVEAPFAPWINSTEPGYAFANLRQRNQFATLTNMALAVMLAWVIQRGAAKVNGQVTVAVLAAASLLAVGNAASASRTGAVQIVLLCFLFGLWGGWRQLGVRLILATTVAAYVAAGFVLPYASGFDGPAQSLLARLQAGDELCASRITLWSNVMHLIAQKPWLGWGWGELDYAHFMTLYEGPRFCDILDNAHNLPLHLAVELGVPAALAICGGFAWWVLRQKPWLESDESRQMAWAVIALILLHSMLEYPLWYGPFQIAFVLCLIILNSKPEEIEGTDYSPKFASNMPLAGVNNAQPAINIIATSVVLSATIYAAWDYHRISQIYLQPESRHAAYQDNTLAQARKSWLFADQALFAELMLTPLAPENAEWVHTSATNLLHYSPEPRVVQKLIESAVMLGKDAEALWFLVRFKAAFPKEHAAWAKANSAPLPVMPIAPL